MIVIYSASIFDTVEAEKFEITEELTQIKETSAKVQLPKKFS